MMMVVTVMMITIKIICVFVLVYADIKVYIVICSLYSCLTNQ